MPEGCVGGVVCVGRVVELGSVGPVGLVVLGVGPGGVVEEVGGVEGVF